MQQNQIESYVAGQLSGMLSELQIDKESDPHHRCAERLLSALEYLDSDRDVGWDVHDVFDFVKDGIFSIEEQVPDWDTDFPLLYGQIEKIADIIEKSEPTAEVREEIRRLLVEAIEEAVHQSRKCRLEQL